MNFLIRMTGAHYSKNFIPALMWWVEKHATSLIYQKHLLSPIYNVIFSEFPKSSVHGCLTLELGKKGGQVSVYVGGLSST